jgi:VCBS repeat-containing protein
LYDGGSGRDTLVLTLTQAQLDEMNASSVFTDFAAVAGTNALFHFSAYGFRFDFDLTVRGFEQIQTVVIARPEQRPVANADNNAIDEDGVSATVSGNVLANDTDADTPPSGLSVVDTGVRAGLYGTLTLNSDGSYSYVVDNTNAAVNALNDGDALQDIFSYTVTDGIGDDTAQLTITINGNTDPALFTEGNDFVDFDTVAAGT